MKNKLFVLIAAALVFICAFTLTISLLFELGNSFEITFAADKDIFSGLSVDVEVFNHTDKYSLSATLSAGESAEATMKYDDSYYDHYEFSHEHKSDADGLDLTYINIRKLILAEDRSILLYRIFDGTPIVVSEDEDERVYIQTWDKSTKALNDICDLYIESRDKDTPAIDYSNGVACVKLASRNTYKDGKWYTGYSYRAVDMSSHTLAAYGDIYDRYSDRVDFACGTAYTVEEIFDVLWQNGVLYIIENANCRTAEYGDISALPSISAITKDGVIASAQRLFTGNFAPSNEQYIKVSFTD